MLVLEGANTEGAPGMVHLLVLEGAFAGAGTNNGGDEDHNS